MLIERAKEFARLKHAEHVRKYSGEPYFVHLEEVAIIVASVPHTEEMVAAAYLHDTVEDTATTLDEIREAFGPVVASYVEMLTDVSKPEDGNRKVRKEKDRQHSAQASPEAKTIKLADLISNSVDILGHAARGNKDAAAFSKLFIKEKEALLEVLSEGDQTLLERAKSVVVSVVS